jgi:hypothetical protein
MKKGLLLAAGLMACCTFPNLQAQVKNEGLANTIIAARQKNGALMKQYSWSCRMEFLENGTIKDSRVDIVTYGPDGNLQYTSLSNQESPLPGGFFRKRIAEKEREKTENHIKGLRAFLHQYTMSSAGSVINFISQSTIPAPGADGNLQLTGGSVIVPGDTVSIWVNAPTKETRRMKIMTFYEGEEVTMTASFRTLKSGLDYMAFGQVDIPDKGLSLQVQNFDYVNQNM